MTLGGMMHRRMVVMKQSYVWLWQRVPWEGGEENKISGLLVRHDNDGDIDDDDYDAFRAEVPSGHGMRMSLVRASQLPD